MDGQEALISGKPGAKDAVPWGGIFFVREIQKKQAVLAVDRNN